MNIRSKSGESYDEDVKNVMICLPCREKYYADNKVKDSYVPSTTDFDKNPDIFGCVSFRKKTVEKHSADNNTFHRLAVSVTRENNLQEEAHGSMSMVQQAFVSVKDSQPSKMKILFINTYALNVVRSPICRI